MPTRRLMASVAAMLTLASGGRGGGADPAPAAGRAGHQSRLDRLAALHSVLPASRQALEAMQAAKATRGARAASSVISGIKGKEPHPCHNEAPVQSANIASACNPRTRIARTPAARAPRDGAAASTECCTAEPAQNACLFLIYQNRSFS
jgi:hypothetical protein